MDQTKYSAKDIILMLLEIENGKISGKTLLQKQIYFISVFLDYKYGYSPHYYGPFSQEIDNGIEANKGLGFIEEKTLGFGSINKFGTEIRRFDYILTDDGKEVVGNIKNKTKIEYRKLKSLIEKSLLVHKEFFDSHLLSIAAKTYFILFEKEIEMTPKQIKKTANQLGWTISEKSLNNSINFLEKIDLVS